MSISPPVNVIKLGKSAQKVCGCVYKLSFTQDLIGFSFDSIDGEMGDGKCSRLNTLSESSAGCSEDSYS